MCVLGYDLVTFLVEINILAFFVTNRLSNTSAAFAALCDRSVRTHVLTVLASVREGATGVSSDTSVTTARADGLLVELLVSADLDDALADGLSLCWVFLT